MVQFAVTDLVAKILDVGNGGNIVSVPQTLADLARFANRICRFVIPGESTNFGTGFLVGPACVMTAAHLFFELETRELVDPQRPLTVKLEFPTYHLGSVAMEGDVVVAGLFNDGIHWAVDPHLDNGRLAHRKLTNLDYAVLRLDRDVGNDWIGFGQQRRGWFDIPSAGTAPVLRQDVTVQILQFIDSGDLRSSHGVITGLSENLTRFFYTAPTIQAASGAPIVDSRLRLAGIHLGGPDFVAPGARNEGLPIRRAAESIDAQADVRDQIATGVTPT